MVSLESKERGWIRTKAENVTEFVARVSIPIDAAATGIFYFFGNVGYAALLAGKTVLDWGIANHLKNQRVRRY